jgi:hypothetical protein
MDIVNWDFLKKGLLVRNTLENPEDLVLVAANTTYKKRGDLFQTYAVPASAFGGGGGATITLQTNGTDNGDQTLLNLRASAGSGIILEDTGSGTVVVSTDAAVVKRVSSLQSLQNIPLLGLLTYQNIDGLFFNVVANVTYSFRFIINYSVSGTGNGVAFSINGPANSFLNYYMLSNPTTTGPGAFIQTLYLTTYNAPPTGTYGSSFSANANFTIIEGTVTPTVGGAVFARITSDGQVGSCFVQRGSYVEYVEIPV